MIAGDIFHKYDPKRGACSICKCKIHNKGVNILFECVQLAGIRDTEQNKIIEKMLMALINDIQGKSNEEKFVYVANGFNSRIIPEWQALYHQTVIFVTQMYKNER